MESNLISKIFHNQKLSRMLNKMDFNLLNSQHSSNMPVSKKLTDQIFLDQTRFEFLYTLILPNLYIQTNNNRLIQIIYTNKFIPVYLL